MWIVRLRQTKTTRAGVRRAFAVAMPSDATEAQIRAAAEEASLILFVTDAQTGVTTLDQAIASMLRREKVFAYRYQGKRYDCGSKEGFLQANVELALAHPELGGAFREYLRTLSI